MKRKISKRSKYSKRLRAVLAAAGVGLIGFSLLFITHAATNDVTFYLSPASTSLAPNQTFTLKIYLQAGQGAYSNKLTGTTGGTYNTTAPVVTPPPATGGGSTTPPSSTPKTTPPAAPPASSASTPAATTSSAPPTDTSNSTEPADTGTA